MRICGVFLIFVLIESNIGLRIPWQFKSLPKERALAMAKGMNSNSNSMRLTNDVRELF